MFADVYNESSPDAFLELVYSQFIEPEKLPGQFGRRSWTEYLGFHDRDGDGSISLIEFMSTAIEWLTIELGVMEQLPEKFRPARYFYSHLESVATPDYWAELSLLQESRKVTVLPARIANSSAPLSPKKGGHGEEL
jgi:hypothetical protein